MRSARRVLIAAATLSLIGVAGTAGEVAAQSTGPEVGAMAPDFAIPGATRYGVLAQPIKLSDFRGKTVVLAFFPRARTRGCTIQMQTYRDQYADLFRSGQDVVLIGISSDSPQALYEWARDDQFQFLFASDESMDVARLYGSDTGRNMAARNLYVIGPDGRVAFRATPFREIDPTAYTELGEALAKVSASAMR